MGWVAAAGTAIGEAATATAAGAVEAAETAGAAMTDGSSLAKIGAAAFPKTASLINDISGGGAESLASKPIGVDGGEALGMGGGTKTGESAWSKAGTYAGKGIASLAEIGGAANRLRGATGRSDNENSATKSAQMTSPAAGVQNNGGQAAQMPQAQAIAQAPTEIQLRDFSDYLNDELIKG